MADQGSARDVVRVSAFMHTDNVQDTHVCFGSVHSEVNRQSLAKLRQCGSGGSKSIGVIAVSEDPRIRKGFRKEIFDPALPVFVGPALRWVAVQPMHEDKAAETLLYEPCSK